MIHRETYTFRNSPYKQIWFRKLENLVNMVFLVEVNNKYGTNLNELCIKNTTPTAGPEFLLRSKVCVCVYYCTYDKAVRGGEGER